NCKNQTKPFLNLYNERYVNDPKFGCYANIIRSVKFFGGASLKSIMNIGEDEDDDNDRTKNPNKEDDELTSNGPFTANIPPAANIVEDCLFDGGSQTSFAFLNDGQNNVLRNCVFTNGRLKISPAFREKNIVSNNKENSHL